MKNIARALRLPFISASVLPFIAGSLLANNNFDLTRFILGLLVVVCVHLTANLMNDYADSKSGADWQDRRFYGFFGGSKLIQEGVLDENWYKNLAICFSILASVLILVLSFMLNSILIIVCFVIITLLALSYSVKPLQLSYRRMGEVVIFILFGIVPVMGGYFIQTKLFPTLQGFLISLPFGFLTTAILYVNEVPDYLEDEKIDKLTWVSLFGQKNSYIGYSLLMSFAFASILLCVRLSYLNRYALVSFIFILLAIKATKIINRYYYDKAHLLESSKITIAIQNLVSIVLIICIIL